MLGKGDVSILQNPLVFPGVYIFIHGLTDKNAYRETGSVSLKLAYASPILLEIKN